MVKPAAGVGPEAGAKPKAGRSADHQGRPALNGLTIQETVFFLYENVLFDPNDFRCGF